MRRLTLSDMEHGSIVKRLIFEKCAQLDAARIADRNGAGNGDAWRRHAERTHHLIQLMNSAEVV